MFLPFVLSLTFQSFVNSDVKLVQEFVVGADAKAAVKAFKRLCAANKVEFPLNLEAMNVFHRSQFPLSAVKKSTFEATLWSNACRPSLMKSGAKGYEISPVGIHCFANVTSGVLLGYSKLLKDSTKKNDWTFAMAACNLQLSRLQWSIKKAGKPKLPGFDLYIASLNTVLAKYPAGSFEKNRSECLRRWQATGQELADISEKYLR